MSIAYFSMPNSILIYPDSLFLYFLLKCLQISFFFCKQRDIVHIHYVIFFSWEVGRVFANGPGDLGSIPGRVIPKTLKMVLDTSVLNTQQYKVRIKDKVEQSWEKE